MFLLLVELGGVGQEGVVVRRVLRQLHPKVFQYLNKEKEKGMRRDGSGTHLC